MRSVGLSLADIRAIPLSPPEAAAAFARGALDGWIVWDSYFALAQRDAHARVLLDGRRLPPTSSFYLASRAFAGRAPAQLSAVLNALKATAAREQGFTTLLVTHDVGEAVALADRILILDGGRVALELASPLPRPRSRGSAEFAALEGRLLQVLLSPRPPA